MPGSTMHESQSLSAATVGVKSIKATARLAGIMYLVMAVLMVFSFMYVPGTFVVAGDAAATARNISERTLLYRVGLLTALLSHILFIFVVLTLYRLFKQVDEQLARLMAVLVCVGVAVEIANLINRAAPLVLLSGSEFLAVFTKPQLEALAFAFVRLGNTLGQIAIALWGLWLIPFGMLTIKSGFFPKVLGWLLYVSGFAYMVGCVTNVVFPGYARSLSPFLFPLYMGELGIVFWMAVLGAKETTRQV